VNRTEVAVDSLVLQRYVGEYELVPAFHIVVTREAARVFIQATAHAFGRDGLVLRQNGQHLPARKIR
jgi:hypothetical protein